MPLQQTSGNVTADAYGGGVAAKVNYIENYFQTWLRTGTGASTTVTTGLDASANKALVWTKSRSAATDHKLTDTVRGATKALISDTTGAQTTDSTGLTAFSSTGYTIGADANYNNSGATYVDWEFVATPKFFDVVTYTGTGSATTIAHSLGSVPGCIMVKRTDTTADWQVYHGSLANTQYMVLNTTAAVATGATRWNSTTPTSSVFSVGTDATVNASGGTYVAYIFAHNAGGFGLTNTDNVISCGSFTGDGTNVVNVNLGYEPQWVMFKGASGAYGNVHWVMIDNMRGMTTLTGPGASGLKANTAEAEFPNWTYFGPTATGFQVDPAVTGTGTFIYIAIRRGPMKVPTDATKVFGLNARAGTGAGNTQVTGGQTDDLAVIKNRGYPNGFLWASRLTGTRYLTSDGQTAEIAAGTSILAANPWDVMDGVKVGSSSTLTNNSGYNYINYLFRRAPTFFDVVCYTGSGTAATVTHNLGSKPAFLIIKERDSTSDWPVAGRASSTQAALFNVGSTAAGLNLTTKAYGIYTDSSFWTTTTFSPSTIGADVAAATYVAYLFGLCPGVSSAGAYTGNGTTQTIDCGFPAGARFVLIKRTDAVSDWYVYDTARGMTSLTDPYLLANTTASDAATLGSVTTVATGFALNAAILAAINVNAGTYIFLAIA